MIFLIPEKVIFLFPSLSILFLQFNSIHLYIYCIVQLIHMKGNEGQHQHGLTNNLPIQNPRQVLSEHLQEYKRLASETPCHQDIQRMLIQHEIIYDQQSPYQPFSFEVQWIVPIPNFYKINAKIAHFAFSITAVRYHQSNTFKESRKLEGSFGIISFAQFDNKGICFKGFSFSDQYEFQSLFKKVVKELSLLKICSALECGPHIDKYFGFDLVIYDNYILYATQEGQLIDSFTQSDQESLKSQLALLHKLKIVHCDIKPENIIFSKFLQKPVFIDFGMSQIIEQQVGFKTLGFFRGTPSYCTNQMISLMIEQPNYVDLYYNDAFCLNIANKQMELRNFKNKRNCRQQLLEQKQTNRYQWLYLLAFKYHYLYDKQFECKLNLRKYLSFGGKIKIVLEFIRKVFQYTFIDSIFDVTLKKYNDHVIYQEIMKERKLYLERIFFQQRHEADESIMNQANIVPISYSPNKQGRQSFDKDKKRTDFAQLFQIIMNIPKIDEKNIWQCLSLVFKCLRFDICNLSVQQKYLISKTINPLLEIYRAKQSLKVKRTTEIKIDFEQIKQLLKSILELCLYSKRNEWSNNIIFDIFQQLALLDVDLSQLIDPFLYFIQSKTSNSIQLILSAFECNRLKNTMLLIHSCHMDKVEIVQNKLALYVQRKISIFKQQTCKSTNKEIISIRNTIQAIQNNYNCSRSYMTAKQKDLLTDINHQRIRKVLFYLIVQKSISFEQFVINNESFIQKSIYLKRCWESNKFDFFCWISIMIKLIKIASINVELHKFFKQAGRIINCNEIMNNIMKNSWTLHLSHQTIFNQKINKLLISYPKLNSLSKQGDIALHLIIQQIISGSIVIDFKLRNQLKELYSIYESSYIKSKSQINAQKYQCMHHYCQTFWRAEIQAFFYDLSPETQGMLMIKLKEAQNGYEYVKSKRDADQYQKCYFFFKFYLYRFNFLKLQGKIQESICNLLRFISYCERLNLQLFSLEGFKKIMQFACNSQKINLIDTSTTELYYYCIKTNFLSFYLLPHHSSYTFITIITLAEYNKQIFYQFLWNLIQFLKNHSINSYFATLIAALDKFLQKDPKNGYLIHYSRLEEKFPTLLKNSYFLIFYMYSLGKEANSDRKLKIFKVIASHIDSLSQFAKRKILQKYFMIHISFFQGKKLQQRLFNFQRAKKYLKQEKIIFEAKRLLCVKWDSVFSYQINSKLKEKVQGIIENVSSSDKFL